MTAPQKRHSPWDDAKDAEMDRLWAEGHSTAEIGRRIGVSKNAVIGRARRIGVSGRPSAIKPPSEASKAAHARAEARAAAPKVAPAKAVPAHVVPVVRTCQFPLWGYGARPTHRYCGAPALSGSSWCSACRARVFTKPRVPGSVAA